MLAPCLLATWIAGAPTAPGPSSVEATTSTVTTSGGSTTSTVTTTDGLTTGVRRIEAAPIDVGRLLLDAPTVFTELALMPIAPLVMGMEKLRIHERLFDLFTNDERTFGVFPLLDVFDRSGFGAGVAVVHNDPLGSPDRVVVVGMLRQNLDRSLSLNFSRRIPGLWGQAVSASAGYSVNRDIDYYGLGPDRVLSDRRALRIDSLNFTVGLDLPVPRASVWTWDLRLAFRTRHLMSGTARAPSLTPEGDIPLPPGFGRRLDYPEARLSFEYDSRDAAGRITTGIVAQASGLITRDVQGGATSAVGGTAGFTSYFSLLPLNRVLVVSLKAGAMAPFVEGDEVPFHSMINLGGNNVLRGYRGDRFVDRLGWWGTVEYRYYIFEYLGSGYGLSANLFADVGRVGRTPKELFDDKPGWSVGFGLRAEHNLFFFGRVGIAYSPEGFRVTVGVGEVP